MMIGISVSIVQDEVQGVAGSGSAIPANAELMEDGTPRLDENGNFIIIDN